MSEVQAEAGAGETGSTGGESTELPNTGTGATGADQGGEGGQAGAGEGGGEATGGESGGESGGEGGQSSTTTGEPKDDAVNKRFSDLTKREREAQRQAREANENLRRALEALERANGGKKPEATPTPTPAADEIGPEPEPPEFIDPEQYQRDMAAYAQKVTERTVKLQLRTERTNQEREAAERANRQQQEEHGRAWQTRRTKAMEEIPDYADVAENPDISISQTMAIAITSSDHGPKIAYYLGQHPELAERISKMQPALQLMELGKLEAQVSAPKKPPVTKVPDPIKVLTGSGEPQTKSVDEMSMEEYAAHRKSKH